LGPWPRLGSRPWLGPAAPPSLGLALPRFRQVRAGGASDELDRTPLLEWNIEQVCQWVGKQPFSSYRSKFRDGMVSGAVLLSLTDKGESRNAET
jgi:hypothetical protein